MDAERTNTTRTTILMTKYKLIYTEYTDGHQADGETKQKEFQADNLKDLFIQVLEITQWNQIKPSNINAILRGEK